MEDDSCKLIPHALEEDVIVGSWIHRPFSIAPFRAIGNAVRIPILSGFPLTLTANFREASCTIPTGKSQQRLMHSTNLVTSLVLVAGCH